MEAGGHGKQTITAGGGITAGKLIEESAGMDARGVDVHDVIAARSAQ
jgi:hypothetical protein